VRSILAFLTIIGLGAPAGMILCGWCLVTGDIMPCYMVACAIVRVGLWVAGVRVVVEGLETVPAHTACIFMANHVSNLDPPVLIPVLPGRTAVFLKRSLMKIPVLGYAMRLANFIPVDRAGSVQTAQENVRLARKVIEAGIHITTFRAGFDFGDGGNDGQGEQPDPAGDGAGGVSCAGVSGGGGEPGGADGGGAGGGGFGAA